MTDSYCFPPELVNPKLKEEALYGLQYVKAAYYSNNRYGSTLFNQHSDLDALIELAQGRQSTDNIRKLFGRHKSHQDQTSDGAESISYIDLQVLNLAPKYVNRAVAKMQRINFDVGLEAVDIVSTNEKEDFAATVQSYYRYKGFLQEIGVPAQTAFPDLDVDTLPQHADELLFDITTNPKIKKEIDGELTLQLVQSMNNFKQVMREVDWDMVVGGFGHLHCFHDANMLPRVERIDPRFWAGSYIDNDNFEPQEYAYFYDCITVNQFIKESSREFSQSEMQEIISRYTLKNQTYQNNLNLNNKLANYDNLDYIPVIKFYFLSQDDRKFVSKKNQYGSKILLEKGFDYNPSDEVAKRYMEGGDSKVLSNTYTSVYGGTWIIDSEIVYNYGRTKVPRTNLVNASLPIKTFATNFKNGRAVSFMAQMKEPLYMINVAWNKIKQTLAQGWIGTREIDMAQLEQVAMGRGGNMWTPRDVIDLLYMDNTLLKRSVNNPYGQSNGRALEHSATGITLADHFNTLQLGFNMLDQMTGSSIAESTEKPDRPSVWGMKASTEIADMDMEYLYNGHEYLYERTSHTLLLLSQESKKNKVAISGFIPALGKVNSGYYSSSEQIAYCEYGMRITRQPSKDEWMEFYQDVRIALEQQRIGPSDSAFIRNIDNLKQAREILVIREKQFERKMAALKQQDIEANMQANDQSIQRKLQADMMLEQNKAQMKGELLKIQGQIDLMLQQRQTQDEGILKGIDGMNKKRVADSQNQATIIKEALRSNSDKYKVITNAQVDREKVKIQASSAKKK